jgi:hypothetical protein
VDGATTAKHDDNATSWRDLSDLLTAEQIARFERVEQLCVAGAHLVFPQNDRSETLAYLLAACSNRRAGKRSRTWDERATGRGTVEQHHPNGFQPVDRLDALRKLAPKSAQ